MGGGRLANEFSGFRAVEQANVVETQQVCSQVGADEPQHEQKQKRRERKQTK